MAYPNVTMKINPPVYQRVTAIKQQMEGELQRQVSYSEALDKMADHWEATDRLARDAKRRLGDPPLFEMHYSEVREQKGQAK